MVTIGAWYYTSFDSRCKSQKVAKKGERMKGSQWACDAVDLWSAGFTTFKWIQSAAAANGLTQVNTLDQLSSKVPAEKGKKKWGEKKTAFQNSLCYSLQRQVTQSTCCCTAHRRSRYWWDCFRATLGGQRLCSHVSLHSHRWHQPKPKEHNVNIRAAGRDWSAL